MEATEGEHHLVIGHLLAERLTRKVTIRRYKKVGPCVKLLDIIGHVIGDQQTYYLYLIFTYLKNKHGNVNPITKKQSNKLSNNFLCFCLKHLLHVVNKKKQVSVWDVPGTKAALTSGLVRMCSCAGLASSLPSLSS